MTRSLLNALFLALLATSPAVVAGCGKKPPASANDDVLLGQRVVDFGGDHDTIPVTAAEGTFSKIQIKVTGSEMAMHGMRITFGNGEVWKPEVRHHFGEGTWTRVIDLPGGDRVIRKIDFLYKSKGPRTGKATVKVFGIR